MHFAFLLLDICVMFSGMPGLHYLYYYQQADVVVKYLTLLLVSAYAF